MPDKNSGDKQNGTEVPRKKISMVEIVLITPALLLSDLADVAANLALGIPVVGEVTVIGASFANFVIMAGFQLYLFMRGIKNLAFLAGAAIDIIPGVDALPAKTAGWIALVLMVNHPKLGRVVKAASGNVSAVMKK
jgi:hypothetical protein